MSLEIGQRVRCPGGLTGDVVQVGPESVLVYMGTYDGKPCNRTFPIDRVRPTIDQELEDLL